MKKKTSEISEGIKEISRDVRLYVEKRFELFSLSISEQISFILADSLQRAIGILLLGSGGFFLWMALGFYLGELLQSNSLGFLIASLPLLLSGFLFLRIHPVSVTKKIQSDILKQMLDAMDMRSNEMNAENNKKEKTEADSETK
jgi:hypothetical protein